MFTRLTQYRIAAAIDGWARQIGKAAVIAGTVGALSLTAVPTIAQAGGVGTGAAVGLGVLGGVLASAAIAASTSPVYGAPPPPAYGYPTQPSPGYYYYSPAPAYYPGPSPYYSWSPYR